MTDLSGAMRRVDAEREEAIGGAGAPFVEERPANVAELRPGAAAPNPVMEAAVAVRRRAEMAYADAMSVVARAALRGGQPAGVFRHQDAEAVNAIHGILCGVQDADVQPIVGLDAE